MTAQSRAVFLSYASQDAEAAQHICEALTAAGIEVWFDQSELRGGDAWDQKIRRQIKDCALFIALVSANTQAREEGYFRLEWRLADQRTHLMARNKAFILPVAIDGTPDAGADVPESFLAVQWTRLPVGATSPAFTERVSRLLAPDRAQLTTSAASQPSAATVPAGAAVHSEIPEKSIAVLPFVDMSAQKDQEYFLDGLAEALIDLLTQVRELRVPARTSCFYFKGKTADIAEIAERLRVAHVLEGSVRKAGSMIRITARLIRAENGYHLWSQSFDRGIEDIFKVQDEIAAAVVEALKIQLLPAQPAANQKRTANAQAYNDYLLGRQFLNRSSPDGYRLAVSAFERTLALDANFAPAYIGLAEAQAWLADTTTGDIEALRQAQAAADRAVALAPDLATGYAVRGWLRSKFFWDWAGAQADMDNASALGAGDSNVELRRAELLASVGLLHEAAAAVRHALDADPLSAPAWQDLGQYLLHSGQLGDARAALTRALQLNPDSMWAQTYLGFVALLEGHADEALAIANSSNGQTKLVLVAMAAHTLGQAVEAQEALDRLISGHALSLAYQIAQIHAWRGEKDPAFEWLARGYAQHDGGMVRIKFDPTLAALRADARFESMLRQLNLSE